jgi:hypothetical protein
MEVYVIGNTWEKRNLPRIEPTQKTVQIPMENPIEKYIQHSKAYGRRLNPHELETQNTNKNRYTTLLSYLNSARMDRFLARSFSV